MNGWAWECPECGDQNPPDLRWCWTCGTDRPEPIHDDDPPAETVRLDPTREYL